jgi:hypothetical protein
MDLEEVLKEVHQFVKGVENNIKGSFADTVGQFLQNTHQEVARPVPIKPGYGKQIGDLIIDGLDALQKRRYDKFKQKIASTNALTGFGSVSPRAASPAQGPASSMQTVLNGSPSEQSLAGPSSRSQIHLESFSEF